jgi:Holliday junction DNA helicase RuvA
MIAYLSGQILKKFNKSIIINTGQVGYLVNITESLCNSLNEGDETEFFTYTHVREDALEIFGFQTFKELEFFKMLLSISGVGPKTAQEIISLPIDKLKLAIINEDAAFICTVPKVGKKIADRIILELKNKITVENIGNLDRNTGHSSITQVENNIYTALEKLGYSRRQIQQGLKSLPEDMKTPQQIIKFFLQNA